MDKKQTIEAMWKVWNKIDDHEAFAGQARLKDKVRDQINFIEGHKTDAKLEALLLKECKNFNIEANKLVQEKAARFRRYSLS